MLTAIYTIISIIVFFKLMGFMLDMACGLAKLIAGLIFWPIVIIAAILGLIWIALPILIIAGVLTSIVRV